MIMRIVTGILFGLFGHRLLREPTSRWFPSEGLNRLASYAEGGTLVLLVFVIISWTQLDKQAREQSITMLVMALFGVGAGTVAGWLIDLERGRG